MINVTVVKYNQHIITIEATGHSGYAESGADIVCSAVSTLLQSLIVGLDEVVKVEPNYTIDEKIPHLSVSVSRDISHEKMKEAQILMKSIYLGLKKVADGYAKFIKIKEKHNV